MMVRNIRLKGVIWKIIPELSLLHLFILSTAYSFWRIGVAPYEKENKLNLRREKGLYAYICK